MISDGCPETVAGLDLSRPALLEASAGTGKTYAIEHLVLRLLIENPNIDLPGILVLTFTEKATGELKEKIRGRLAWRIAGGGLPAATLARLKEALLNFDRASIHTIHGFCQRVLRKYAFENNALFRTELVRQEREVLEEVLAEEMRSTWLSEAGAGPEGLAAFRNLAGALRLGSSPTWSRKLIDIARSLNPLRGDLLLPEYDAARIALSEAAIAGAVLEVAGMLPDLAMGLEAEHPFALRYRSIKFANATVRKKAPLLLEALLRTAARCRGLAEGKGRIAAALAFLERKAEINLTAVDKTGFIANMMPKPEEFAGLPWPELEKLIGLMETIRRAALDREREQAAHAFHDQRRVILSLRAKAQAFKKARGMISYDDMIEDVCLALRGKPERVRMLRQDYRCCLVDEFQDTDPLQWEIFRDVFLRSGSANPLYLIGDPKQAIYRFRGGDIHTYMEARKDLFALSRDGKAQGRGLETNFRSSRGMVEACNAVFAHKDWFHTLAVDPGDPLWRLSAKPDPLGYVPVGFGGLPVQEASDRTSRPFPIVLADFTGNRQVTSGEAAAGKPAEPAKAELQRRVNAWIASEIAALMSAPERMQVPDKVTGRLRPLVWSDICVLVKKNREKTRLERALIQSGIPVQIDRRSGLYQSEAAGHFLAMLESLEDPGDAGKHARALLSRFFRAPGDAPPSRPPDEPHPLFEEWIRSAGRRRWQRLFHSLLYRTGLLYRESLEEDGDRRIMDFLHIAQNLVQEALGRNLGLTGLVQRLRDLRAAPPGAEEEQDMHREESEGGKTVLMTMHGSKGLEFPIVFLACFSGNPPRSYYKYRDGMHTVFNLAKDDAPARKAFEAESDGEDRRLFYVALTRARYKLYAPILPKGSARSSHGPLGGFVSEALLAASAARPDLIHWEPAENHAYDASGAGGTITVPAGSVKSASPGAASGSADLFAGFPREDRLSLLSADFSKRRRRLSSYSHLVRNSHGPAAEEVSGRFDKEEAAVTPELREDGDPPEPEEDPFPGNAVPRGRETGNMFHEILEIIDFAAVAAAASPEALLAHAPSRDIITGRMRDYRLDGSHLPGIAGIVWHTLRTIVPDPAGGAPFRLGDMVERRAEMEFLFPYGGNPDGYLWGFVDLVFRHRGRYYLLDWKSNHLGGYSRPDLEKSMRESRYDLQYMLYSLALDKWLRSLIPDYDHARHFGGVYYIYLRGMVAAPEAEEPSGVYALRPTPDQMRKDYPMHLAKAMGGPAGGALEPALIPGLETGKS